MENNSGENKAETTVRQLAEQSREQLRAIMPGGEFARRCMDFDYLVCEAASAVAAANPEAYPDEHGLQLEETLRLLAHSSPADSSAYYQLALCWLDAKGYGEMPASQLEQVIERVRRHS